MPVNYEFHDFIVRVERSVILQRLDPSNSGYRETSVSFDFSVS